MQFAREQTQPIARLARLGLQDPEIDALQGDLNAILGYVDKLSELDVSDVEPTTHTAQITGALREDVVEQRLTPEDILANAPDTDLGRFRVPKVLADKE